MITPAMMRFINKDEELAFILAHELSHNIMGHPQSLRQNALGGAILGALADALAGRGGVNTHGDFTRAGAEIGVLAYSADFEREADYVGMYILARSGYRPDDVPNFWRRLSVKQPKAIFVGVTHPTNPERYVTMQKAIAEVRYKQAHRQALLPERMAEAQIAPAAGR